MKMPSRLAWVVLASVIANSTIASRASAETNSKTESSKESSKMISFNFENTELTQVITTYAKASGRKFVIDPSVRGKVTILSPKSVSFDEAFNLLCEALAVNGFSISDRDDTTVIMSSRNIQRSFIPQYTELPPMKPERMVSMIFQMKYVSADDINRQLRILPSKDGEMTPWPVSNKVIVTDYVSNLHRIAKLIADLDQPTKNSK